MVAMIMESMASILWFFVLVICLLYTFGILVTQGANDWCAFHAFESGSEVYMVITQYWGSFTRSLFTLSISVTEVSAGPR